MAFDLKRRHRLAVSRTEGPPRAASQDGPRSLHEQLDHLGLDDDLRRLVGEGLRRLPAAEQDAVASDLQLALDSLRPALAILGTPSGSASQAHIGSSVILKGHLTANEDVTIDGRIEGTVEARMSVVTIAHGADIRAVVIAKRVVVFGSVTGNVIATEKVDLRNEGSIDGDITSPRVSIAEGASFRGSIDMQRGALHVRPEPASFQPIVARA